jgi:oligosaccharide reducing-end xylanase
MTIKQSLKAGVWLVSAAGMISAAVDPAYEVGTWENFCKGAISHTFDDYGQGSLKNAAGDYEGQQAFDAKGFHSTIFVITGDANNNSTAWSNLKKAAAKGHEIGSHAVTHPNSGPMNAADCGPSQTAVRSKVPGEKCVSIAYPNCNTPGKNEVLKYYVVGRSCFAGKDGVNDKTPTDFSLIDSKMFGTCSSCPNDASSLNSFADAAVTKNGWAVSCHHGIGSETHGWAVTNLNAMKSHLDYLDKNRDKIWIETFGNVARYIKERDAASIAVKSSDDKSITITVTDNLVDSVFNYPLSIRRALPDGWTTAAVTQKGVAVDDSIITVNSKKYVMFKAVPDGGDIVISSGAVGVIRHSSRTASGISPVTLQNGTIAIDAQYFSNSALTVELFDLKGKVIARQNLTAGQSSIALTGKNIGSSAFIANISGGNTKWTGKFIPQL